MSRRIACARDPMRFENRQSSIRLTKLGSAIICTFSVFPSRNR